MGHARRPGHGALPAPLLLPVIPIRWCRPGHGALLPVLPYLLQIRRRGDLLPPMVLLILWRLLVLPVIRRCGGFPPVVLLLVLWCPLLLVLPVIWRHGGLPLLLVLLLIPVGPWSSRSGDKVEPS
jgi:hypothetical protein